MAKHVPAENAKILRRHVQSLRVRRAEVGASAEFSKLCFAKLVEHGGGQSDLLQYLQENLIELANLLLAIVGLPVLIWHVRAVHKDIEAQTINIKAQTLGHLYDHYFTLCQILLQKPYLRGYLYDGDVLTNVPDKDDRCSEVDTICELMNGLLEHAVIQQGNVPEDAWSNCWNPFLKDMYKRADSELARFYGRNRHFYSKHFQNVVDSLLAAAAPPVCPPSAFHSPG